MKLDIACGQNKADGFIGIDIARVRGVDLVHDLSVTPWPVESDSVTEARCSHYFEHVPRFQRPAFMSEVWRVLKMGGRITLITPLGLHRQFQDFTHAWPVFPESYQYFDRTWLYRNGLDHYINLYGINCNFRIGDVMIGATSEFAKGSEAQVSFAAQNYVRGGSDMVITLEKLPL